MNDARPVLTGFDALPRTPAEHFKLWFYTAVLHLLAAGVARFDSWEALFDRFPFLARYNNELAHGLVGGLEAGEAYERWWAALAAWEDSAHDHLPLLALRRAASLDRTALAALMLIGLVDEDSRFGAVFDELQGASGQRRPSTALLCALDLGDAGDARTSLKRLRELALVQPVNADVPRGDWTFQVSPAAWDAVRGHRHATPGPGLRYLPPEALTPLDRLIVQPALQRDIEALPALIASGDCDAIVVRGPYHNGRGTIAGAVARALGRGVLEITGAPASDQDRWRAVGPLATLLHAVPLVRLDLAPGESIEVRALEACDAPLAVVAGRHGGLGGDALDRAITLNIDWPDPNLRARHWASACDEVDVEAAAALAPRFRLTSGGIHRAARLARARAAMAGRTAIEAADVQEAARSLGRQALDTLAARVATPTDWSHVAVAPHTRRELEELERRCRHREHLHAAVGPALAPQLTCGVKALFTGPSGSGKTLCARALAASLQLDLYRVDLSAILNKYVGETEKNLNQVFARAEELDVVLLIDEGDAFLTGRTRVVSSTDRYANFETSFLLQRLESFEGILIVTTNAAERIDGAFQRRLDVVVEFTPPGAVERLAIWRLHLPVEHAVDEGTLAQVTSRCAMTGGQIRNAVLHATSLALDNGGRIIPAYLHAAIQREYRKAGAACPLGGLDDGR